MPYIDEEFLVLAFGQDQVCALCPTPEELDTVIELAEAEVESALTMGGYSTAVPSSVFATVSVVPKVIKLAAYGAWLELAHLRQRKELPETARAYTAKIELLSTGRLEIPNLTKNVRRAVGGHDFTESDPDITPADGSRSRVFTTDTLDGF